MSRIGKKPVDLPANVKVTVKGNDLTVESGSNKLQFTHRPEVSVRVDQDAKAVVVERQDDSRIAKSLHGLTRALVANMIEGVTKGFTEELELNGVGWNAKLQGQQINLAVGYADVRVVKIPSDVKVEVVGNRIKISGINKQKVGQTAAEIRSHRKPEPYNGKGIKYVSETIIRKAGKAFAGGGG